jgi:excinuclease ABC subunit C
MEEVLARRFKRWETAQSQHAVGEKVDPSFAFLPDLLIVDGGKGQLGRAIKVLDQFNLAGCFTIAGLAKENELLYLPARSHPVALPRKSQGLHLVQRVRDEAHRFAITAHRNLRSKERLISRLDQIPGIGPARKKALLKKFGSLEGVKNASREQLAEIPGITEKLAEDVLENLNVNPA